MTGISDFGGGHKMTRDPSSPAAIRQRRYRQRRKAGVRIANAVQITEDMEERMMAAGLLSRWGCEATDELNEAATRALEEWAKGQGLLKG